MLVGCFIGKISTSSTGVARFFIAHCSIVVQRFYNIRDRALDLTTDIIENAGGIVLCAGHDMLRADVANAVATTLMY